MRCFNFLFDKKKNRKKSSLSIANCILCRKLACCMMNKSGDISASQNRSAIRQKAKERRDKSSISLTSSALEITGESVDSMRKVDSISSRKSNYEPRERPLESKVIDHKIKSETSSKQGTPIKKKSSNILLEEYDDDSNRSSSLGSKSSSNSNAESNTEISSLSTSTQSDLSLIHDANESTLIPEPDESNKTEKIVELLPESIKSSKSFDSKNLVESVDRSEKPQNTDIQSNDSNKSFYQAIHKIIQKGVDLDRLQRKPNEFTHYMDALKICSKKTDNKSRVSSEANIESKENSPSSDLNKYDASIQKEPVKRQGSVDSEMIRIDKIREHNLTKLVSLKSVKSNSNFITPSEDGSTSSGSRTSVRTSSISLDNEDSNRGSPIAQLAPNDLSENLMVSDSNKQSEEKCESSEVANNVTPKQTSTSIISNVKNFAVYTTLTTLASYGLYYYLNGRI